MCRLYAYMGRKTSLAHALVDAPHSLLVQSYQPREMTAGRLNADGFGVGWYAARQDVPPFLYRQTLPMWHDINFTEHLSRYIQSACFLANVRSATPGQPVQMTNTQPFRWGRWLGVHNGFIENFRQTLYRPMRDRLSDICYNIVEGSTDSEHLFALFCNELVLNPQLSPLMVLRQTLQIVFSLAQAARTSVSAAMILTDGVYILATRCGRGTPPPTLYWSQDAEKIQLTSEPVDQQTEWYPLPENKLLLMSLQSEPEIYTF
ncbi:MULTISPECIES: ergothioneine biosynthesis protein EgtC [unclassified Thermosynechococcus]|uniref:ergothioneine biosynthesis protein EgtC n=1 Tax=unclassified Thermosynechococcus TaxID=2622553 RepID=UPI00267343E2|nr:MULTISPECIES: ergothioneine biosynthesis protein EgtC [unclassified Thermosynechococcus]WKT81972.1 ergothioneine biosynthesis protein EgtC [Thermosynechococcus sp. PP45]WNC25585.1 ergothioneine biosynthesis protein EgtC [Thermosynechococcus sp. PP551]WNC28164.1 ergothioneine biosynthesis protein EgtC [Thermosynechococcus sp. PP555]WNC30731.1 ergothioneine biosynthesis protein EgtC [Thermosynechococcus sp. PKX82]